MSADASTVAYLNEEGKLRVSFQQPYGNVDCRALSVERTFTRVALSPSGRTIVATAPTPGAASTGRVAPSDLWIVDVASGSVREVEGAHGRALAPLSWSPDDAYVVLWRSSGAAGVDATGVPLTMLELATGTLTSLGNGFEGLSQRTWAGPNTFAFASVERPRVDNARIRVWSPGGGVRDVTPADMIAASPTAADGVSLYFVAAAAAGAAGIRVLDLATGSTRALWSDAAYAVQALRVSRDGTLLLVQRRRLADGQLELWLDAADGSAHRAVIRYAPPLTGGDAGRYGALYPELLDGVAWGRA